MNAPLALYCSANTSTQFPVPPPILLGSEFSAVTGGIQYNGTSTKSGTMTICCCVGRQLPTMAAVELGYKINNILDANVGSRANVLRYQGTGNGKGTTLTISTKITLNTSDIIQVSLLVPATIGTTTRINLSDCFVSLA